MNDNNRYAKVNWDGEAWNVILCSTGGPRAEQEFARFDDLQLQIYIYRWCYQGVVCL